MWGGRSLRSVRDLEECVGDAAAEEAAAVKATLLQEADEMRQKEALMDASEIRKMRDAAEEERMRKDADRVQTNALMSAAEVASGTKYSESLVTGWRPPAHIRAMSEEQAAVLRKKWYIIAEVRPLSLTF